MIEKKSSDGPFLHSVVSPSFHSSLVQIKQRNEMKMCRKMSD